MMLNTLVSVFETFDDEEDRLLVVVKGVVVEGSMSFADNRAWMGVRESFDLGGGGCVCGDGDDVLDRNHQTQGVDVKVGACKLEGQEVRKRASRRVSQTVEGEGG